MSNLPPVLTVLHGELLLFAAVFFLLSALDEAFIDLVYLWLRLTGKRAPIPAQVAGIAWERADGGRVILPRMRGPVAVFIPAWAEARVIGATLRHTLAAWPQAEMTIYVGAYRNDPDTIDQILQVAATAGPRLRLVVHDVPGPTCKADCLNRIYAAMCADEVEQGKRFCFVALQDAEDMVDPAGLPLMDHALAATDFVQLPVLALPQARSRWIAGHYSDEFAEAHGKAMVVRDALGAALPGAGVGCAVARDMLRRLAEREPEEHPFGAGSLVEDYELGLSVRRLGGRSRFLRARAADGRLIATRAYFPSTLGTAVRQKTRWTHGIALQAWDRMGWHGGLVDRYMLLRDRRGPFGALLLALAYLLIAVTGCHFALVAAGALPAVKLGAELQVLLTANLAFLLWRAASRAAFTAREFGWAEGLRAVLRIPVSNVIAIMAGRRALVAYSRSLAGEAPRWDKTDHDLHPAIHQPARKAA